MNKMSGPYKSIIVDDEILAQEMLDGLIRDSLDGRVQVLGRASSLREAAQLIHTVRPDLVFLDIDLNGDSGFDLLTHIPEVPFHVIFTTAYSEYALDAIRASALDYLLKPIQARELLDAIERLDRMMLRRVTPEVMKTIRDYIQEEKAPYERMAIPTLEGFTMVDVRNVLYCQAEQNYTWMHMLDRQPILVSKALGYLEDVLPAELFFRNHKSYIVNLTMVDSYSRKEINHITLRNGVKLPVATRRVDAFLKALTAKS